MRPRVSGKSRWEDKSRRWPLVPSKNAWIRNTSECTSPMHSDITLHDARASAASLAIVMSVRCARRRDLPAVIACKHPCGGNTRTVPRSSFPGSSARRHDELIHLPTRHGGWCPLGRTLTTAEIFSRFTPTCTVALGGFRSPRRKNPCNWCSALSSR